MDVKNVNFITALFIWFSSNRISCHFHVVINKNIFFSQKKKENKIIRKKAEKRYLKKHGDTNGSVVLKEFAI
jgi:hypothetical protein